MLHGPILVCILKAGRQLRLTQSGDETGEGYVVGQEHSLVRGNQVATAQSGQRLLRYLESLHLASLVDKTAVWVLMAGGQLHACQVELWSHSNQAGSSAAFIYLIKRKLYVADLWDVHSAQRAGQE